MAERITVSNAAIVRIERGDTSASYETLDKMAEVFRMNYKDLVKKQESFEPRREKTLHEKLRMLNEEQLSQVNKLVDVLIGGRR